MLTIDKLKEYGADTITGMSRCVNNEALYLRLVGMVPKNEGFKNLYDSINSGNLNDAFLAAHGLKGIVSNLSLTPLSILIEEITEPLRNNVDMDYSLLINKIEEERSKLESLLA